jgi:MFS family permease
MGSLSGSIYINTALSFLIELPAFIVCGLLIDRIGRRPLFIWSLLLGGAACAPTCTLAVTIIQTLALTLAQIFNSSKPCCQFDISAPRITYSIR